MTWLGLF